MTPRARGRGAALAAWVLAGALGAEVRGARAHNGFGIAPIFSEPTGLVVTDGATPLVLRWTARESHPEQRYRLKVQPGDFPPTPSPPSALRAGTQLAELAADAPSYAVPLDLSGLASGAWRVYAEFDEPPFCVELEAAPALVVVRRAGDPPPLGVMVTAPLEDSPIVDAAADVRLAAIAPGPGAPTVTIEAGDIVVDPAFPAGTLCVEFTWTPTRAVMADVPLVPDPEAGPDRWKLEATWDTRDVPDGAYLLRVTTRAASGETSTTWARRWINVEHAGGGGPDSGDGGDAGDAGGGDVDVDVDGRGERDAGGGDGCGGAGGAVGLAWIVGLVAVARWRGSDRVVKTARSSRG
ncbi:MAG: hypothetical protein IT385_23990 [Deltaproteobacteria bacterium]|nr:hypothetical protein [Deltaproteobacteria bacterium]